MGSSLGGTRKTFSTRIRPDLKKRLVEAAKTNGRSLSQEIEMRLEKSIWLQKHLPYA